MSTLAERAPRVKLSDPLPGHCAGCFQAPSEGVKFANFDVALDRGAIVQEGTMAVLDSIDELHLCQACVREAADAVEYVPGLHRQHLNALREALAERDRWKAYAERLEAVLSERPER